MSFQVVMRRYWGLVLTGLMMVCGPLSARAESLTAANALTEMSPGWNLGNSLEAIGQPGQRVTSSQETAWGNPVVTPALLKSVKAAGFNSVRIPVAWNQYADASGNISPKWMARVKEVVDYARAADLYVVINIHWDGGWMQPVYADRDRANARIAAYWTQIATAFAEYDDHLLFAGTNEVMVGVDYSPPTAEYCAVQNSFNQAFVNAVRATGGKNASRWLVVQSFNTNIDHALSCNATLPGDTIANRLMMEVHYYDPYSFTLDEMSPIWQWGSIATKASVTDTWGGEDHADAQFAKIKAVFIDRGIPVILGEYAASLKTEHDPSGRYRTYWDEYITRSAYRHGLVPMYWDNGYLSNHASGLFNRSTGAQGHPATIKAIVEAAR